MKRSIAEEKSYDFACKIIAVYKQLKLDREFKLSEQLLKSGTSIGANVSEALAAQSRKDFISKMSIASKEARETRYWLKLLRDSKILDSEISDDLLKDTEELISILTAIVKTSSENNSKLKTQNLKLLVPCD